MLLSGAASPAPARTYTIRVDARDFSFALSKRSVPAGSTVRFVVRNRGDTVHDFVIGHVTRTRVLAPGKSQVITATFRKKGAFTFLCSISGHARLGMKGTFGVSTKPLPVKPPPPVDTSDLVSPTRIGTFDRPVLVTAPPGDTHRLFVVEQTGTVRIVRDGEVLPTPFLDLREKVKVTSEPGLLSIAFAPDYATSGLFYAFYNSTAGNGDIHISEFRRHPTDPDLADPYTERVLLTIVKPWENHNGGMLQFGPDGYLYASVGDGDSGVLNPPGVFAQRKDSLLGKILRIDPRRRRSVRSSRPTTHSSAKPMPVPKSGPTVFATRGDSGSTRSPEAFTSEMRERRTARRSTWLCADRRPSTSAGRASRDPSHSMRRRAARARPRRLLEYARDGSNCAVIGGVVVRDGRLPALAGRYLYGDFCTGGITSVAVTNGTATTSGDLGLAVPELTSFGVDGLDRIYVTSLSGDVFRLDPKPST